MKKQLLFALVVIAALLLATGSATAKTTKRTPFTGFYYNCGVTGPPEEIWTSGDGRVVHVRGEPGEGYARSENAYYNAFTIGISNYNLNQVTLSGGFYGTFIKDVDGVEGGWQGTSAGYFRDGQLYVSVIGEGTGDLAGMKYFAKFVPVENPGADPCPDGAANVFGVTGVILDTYGE